MAIAPPDPKQAPSGGKKATGSPRSAAPKRIAEEPDRRENIYRIIIRTSMDGFWLVDADAHFLEVNDAYCQLIGYSREELLKMRIPDISAIESPEETAARIRKTMETGSDRFETRHRSKDGRIIDIEVSVNYLKTDGGRFFTFLRDITERKRSEERLEFLASIVEQVGEGVASSDLDGKLIFINRAFADMHGYMPEEAAGQHLGIFHTSEQLERDVNPFIEEVKRNGYARRDIGHKRKDGALFMSDMSATLLRDSSGKPVGMTAVIQDVTERKRAEEAIRQQLSEIVSYYDNVPIGLAILDTDLHYLRVNRLLAEINGVSVADHIGKTVKEIVPFLEEKVRELTSEIIETGKLNRPGFRGGCLV